jgi:hypothetical protein
MSKEPAIIPKLRSLGRQTVRLIIRTADTPQDHVEELEQAGLRVHKVFRLIKAVSVEGPASAALKIAGRDWVQALEEDQEVRTQGTSRGGSR